MCYIPEGMIVMPLIENQKKMDVCKLKRLRVTSSKACAWRIKQIWVAVASFVRGIINRSPRMTTNYGSHRSRLGTDPSAAEGSRSLAIYNNKFEVGLCGSLRVCRDFVGAIACDEGPPIILANF